MGSSMKKRTAIILRGEPHEGGYWGTCAELQEATGQCETREECLWILADAVRLLMDTERDEVFLLDPQAETADLIIA